MVAPRMQNMSSQSIKISLLATLLLIMSIPVIAADCKSIRSAYLKERHRCISLFREAYAPNKQPSSGDFQMTDVGVNMCFAALKSDYPEFFDGGECVDACVYEPEIEGGSRCFSNEDIFIDKKFAGYRKKCLHQKDFTECKKALSNVKNVDNIRNSDGATLLMIAAQEGDINAMDFLLQKGASAKKVNHNAKTLLYYAISPRTELFDTAESNDTNEVILKVVQKVLDLGVHPQELSLSGWTTLCSAVKNLSNDVVKLLLEAGACSNLRCTAALYWRETPLYYAIKNNDLEKVSLLLRTGANPNMETSSTFDEPPLFTAVNSNNLEIVKLLVDAGANVNSVAIMLSILEWAENNAKEKTECDCNNENCKKKCDEAIANDKIVAFLKKAGATKPFRGDFVEYCSQPDLTEKMVLDAIKHGADVNESNFKGWTPLHAVAWHSKNSKVVKALIKNGAFVNAATENGETPLDFAEHRAAIELGCDGYEEGTCSQISKDEIVVLLKKAGATHLFRGSFVDYCLRSNLTEEMVYDAIKQGADVNETDSVGWTPLHAVAQEGRNPKAMMALIKKGAFINAMTKKGTTPLLIAARYNSNPAFVEMLVNAGADIYAKSSWWGGNALELAVASNSPEVVERLLKTKLGKNLNDKEKCWLVQSAIRDNPNPDVLKVLFRNGFNAKPRSAIFGLVNFNPLATALSKGKEIEIIKLILQNGGVVNDECMRLARDLPMDTPEQRKYRNQMIDLLTRHKK